MKVARETIILAARELFRSKGYVGASMQDLAERVGLKKASLYMRFPNKEALVPEVVHLTLQETLAPRGHGKLSWNVEFSKTIQAIADSLVERQKCVGMHLAYGASDETPVVLDAVRLFFQAHVDYLSAILSKAMPAETAVAVATDTLARLEGATIFVSLFGDKAAMQRAVTLSIDEAKKAAN